VVGANAADGNAVRASDDTENKSHCMLLILMNFFDEDRNRTGWFSGDIVRGNAF